VLVREVEPEVRRGFSCPPLRGKRAEIFKTGKTGVIFLFFA
jgi:hypothetical protein